MKTKLLFNAKTHLQIAKTPALSAKYLNLMRADPELSALRLDLDLYIKQYYNGTPSETHIRAIKNDKAVLDKISNVFSADADSIGDGTKGNIGPRG
jgi:hypothetical protein